MEGPTLRELLAAGIDLKLQAVVDGKKCYPRDFERPGRLRVQLRNRYRIVPGNDCYYLPLV